MFNREFEAMPVNALAALHFARPLSDLLVGEDDILES